MCLKDFAYKLKRKMVHTGSYLVLSLFFYYSNMNFGNLVGVIKICWSSVNTKIDF